LSYGHHGSCAIGVNSVLRNRNADQSLVRRAHLRWATTVPLTGVFPSAASTPEYENVRRCDSSWPE